MPSYLMTSDIIV